MGHSATHKSVWLCMYAVIHRPLDGIYPLYPSRPTCDVAEAMSILLALYQNHIWMPVLMCWQLGD